MRILVMLLLVVCGCATQPTETPVVRTQISQIPKVERLLDTSQPIVKPKVSKIKDANGAVVAALDKQGMADLIVLYSQAQSLEQQRHQLVTVTNKLVDERNDLLELAKEEEARGNELRAKLTEASNQAQKDRIYNAIELNATRLLLVLSLLAGM